MFFFVGWISSLLATVVNFMMARHRVAAFTQTWFARRNNDHMHFPQI
jgi:hypothetical protein